MVPTIDEEDTEQQLKVRLKKKESNLGGDCNQDLETPTSKFIRLNGANAAPIVPASPTSSTSSAAIISCKQKENYTNNNYYSNDKQQPLHYPISGKTIAEEQETTTTRNKQNTSNNSPNHIINSFVNKSSILLNNIKQHYLTTYLTINNNNISNNMTENNYNDNNNNNKQEPSPIRNKRDITERQLSDSSFFYATSPSHQKGDDVIKSVLSTTSEASNSTNIDMNENNKICSINNQTAKSFSPIRPPLPPPPPKEVLANVVNNQRHWFSTSSNLTPANLLSSNVVPQISNNSITSTQSLDVQQQQKQQLKSNENRITTPTSARRHALQEQSLERDAALSFKLQQNKEHKHRRTASIKSALKYAHIGSLGKHSSEKHNHHHHYGFPLKDSKDHHRKDSSNNNHSDGLAKSMPYELFEPPITQRTFQRSKRRDAMLSDPKRQLSADTIGLRQLTDEYLHNAGVKHMSSSGQCSLVALTPQSQPNGSKSIAPPTVRATTGIETNNCVDLTCIDTTSMSGNSSNNSIIPALAAGQQPATLIENKLYQFSKTGSCGSGSSSGVAVGGVRRKNKHHFLNNNNNNTGNENNSNNGSEDSLSYVAILPGALPWQTDVSIQCELLQAPPMVEPYETTGDILNTIALPFRGSTMQVADLGSDTLDGSGNTSHLSATLKRGLSAVISNTHSHLSPAAAAASAAVAATSGPVAGALQIVGGNLKKSLSNTLDISLSSCVSGHYHNNSNQQTTCIDYLQSQDSLPAYTSFQNEPDSDQFNNDNNQRATDNYANNSGDNSGGGAGGLIGHLASKLSRQSSKKFTVSKKGLQRALSFDCRGFKRLEGTAAAVAAQQQQQHNVSNNTSNSKNHLSSTAKNKSHNKSTLGLNLDQTPRPYLPQSASQVDFQLPLLPYHKMQEAIVGQRLLEPPKQQQTTKCNNNEEVLVTNTKKLDADELICAQTSSDFTPSVEPQTYGKSNTIIRKDSELFNTLAENNISSHQHSNSNNDVRSNSANSEARRLTAPKLVLDIPIITTPSQEQQKHSKSAEENLQNSNNLNDKTLIVQKKCKIRSTTTRTLQKRISCQSSSESHEKEDEYAIIINDKDGEEVSVHEIGEISGTEAYHSSKANNICLPSPNVAIDSGFNALTSSPSFSIGPNNTDNQLSVDNEELFRNNLNTNQLSASDVFTKNIIKRPSTMLQSDAMSQVALALNSTSCLKNDNEQNVVKRNRRQAIVPPKLTTDGGNSPGESAQVGRLVDFDDDFQDKQLIDNKEMNKNVIHHDDAENMTAHRRKRSGGSDSKSTTNETKQRTPEPNANRPSGEVQSALPTFKIQQDDAASDTQIIVTNATDKRPDSQATNIDSIVSSGSSTNLSLIGKRGDFTVTSPGGLTVSFGSNKGRRRSSIAVIPQMQICPGDLLVYSKQLIDRMNQNDNDTENGPPQFLTIDDKKGKNIWSSLKLCAQFDTRVMKARNELLCSLEDVLASLQPSTFIDEQLSHYKGMLWNEFLYETESRRSASSEGLSINNDQEQISKDEQQHNYRDEILTLVMSNNDQDIINNEVTANQENNLSQESAPVGVVIEEPNKISNGARMSLTKEKLKVSISGGITTTSVINSTIQSSQHHRTRETVRPNVTSRFREKPKLKRGQTVDSVFRIPLIPSSPLKHAQQHQQTPTAHLEDHNNTLLIIEDDERSSLNSADSVINVISTRHNRSSSTRSRNGANRKYSNHRDKNITLNDSNANLNCSNNDSSFETDDSIDLFIGSSKKVKNSNQFVRQSSLSTLSSTITRTEQKRQRALWDLFQSECTFFFDHLLTLKNVYMEPLKKIQVEGFAMFADPDVLFGNLDELCCGVYDFCKEFLYIIMRTLKTRPEELNATDVLIKLYKKNPKIDHLRGVYHRYTLNYINALTYLESLRKQVEFVEFERWSSRDVRCKKLQLTDLLVAPVQHIMRVPIILKDIESHTENSRDRDEIRAILAVEEASLRELDDKMRWLKNFERLLEIQKNISWPSVLELDPKLFVPDFLKEVLSKQPCERLIVSPRRQIVHEGTLSNLDSGKASDMHVILFDDMLLLTRRKKGLTKKASTVCKSNSGSSATKDDGSFKYIVYKQPLSLDRFYVHDVQQVDSQVIGMKHLFLLIVMNRFQQICNVHSFLAPNDDVKQTWLFKIKKTSDRWKKNFSSSENQQQVYQQPKVQYQEQIHQFEQNNQSLQQPSTLTRVINRNSEITNKQSTSETNYYKDDVDSGTGNANDKTEVIIHSPNKHVE